MRICKLWEKSKKIGDRLKNKKYKVSAKRNWEINSLNDIQKFKPKELYTFW